MFSLVYLSSEAQPFPPANLTALLHEAREKNLALDITGLLLYQDGNFMQLLEGEEKVVRDLYARIARDRRHRRVVTLLEKPAAERLFPDWSMGFRNLGAEEVENTPGYSRFLDFTFQPERPPEPNAALELLLFFKTPTR